MRYGRKFAKTYFSLVLSPLFFQLSLACSPRSLYCLSENELVITDCPNREYKSGHACATYEGTTAQSHRK